LPFLLALFLLKQGGENMKRGGPKGLVYDILKLR